MKDGHYIRKSDDAEVWVQGGEYHRLDGPAIINTNGYRVWIQDGEIHREDGPAIWFNTNYFEYWLDGEHYPHIQNDVLWRIEVQKIKRKKNKGK